jgi:hypothetical protein
VSVSISIINPATPPPRILADKGKISICYTERRKTEVEGSFHRLLSWREGGGRSVAKFIVPDWEDIVDTGVGLSYWHARLHRLAGRYDNPMTESTMYITQSGIMNLATGTEMVEAPTPTTKKCGLFTNHIPRLLYLYFPTALKCTLLVI